MHFPGHPLDIFYIFQTPSIATAPITDHYKTMLSNVDEKENLAA